MHTFSKQVMSGLWLRAEERAEVKVDCYLHEGADIAGAAALLHALRKRGMDARFVVEPPIRNRCPAGLAQDGPFSQDDEGQPVPLLTPEVYETILSGVAGSGLPVVTTARRDADVALTTGTYPLLARYVALKARLAEPSAVPHDSRFDGEVVPAAAGAEHVEALVHEKRPAWTQMGDFFLDGELPQGLLFSVIIPTYNRRPVLRHCLDALERQKFPRDRFEVLVSDDGSTDDTASFMRSRVNSMNLVCLRQENRGPAAARNMALSRARGKYVLILNDDAIAAPDLLENHYKTHLLLDEQRHAVMGAFEFPGTFRESVLSYLLEFGGYLFGFHKTLTPHRLFDYRFFYTCNISLLRDCVERVGGFDEAFTLPAAEDIELGRRLETQMNMGVYHVPECRTRHEHAQTIEGFRRTQHMRGQALVLFYAKHPEALGAMNLASFTAAMGELVDALGEERIQMLTNKFSALEAPEVAAHFSRRSLGDARFYRTAVSLAPLLRVISDYEFNLGQLQSPHLNALAAALSP